MNKTYQNPQMGFAMDVPENWVFPSGEAIQSRFGQALIFDCGAIESFNIEIGQAVPGSLDLEQEFRRYALGRPYTGLEFGRITASNKNHVWARYQLGTSAWSKKYLIVLGSSEYDMTATCTDPKVFVARQVIWDKVVESFRLTTPQKPASTLDILGRMNQASRFFEIGYSYFKSGEYPKALEQFEKGKNVTHEFPWNFLGTSMTLMQMIEKGLIPNDQIRSAVQNAEANLEICLLISPQEQDYIDRMKAIQELKKKLSL